MKNLILLVLLVTSTLAWSEKSEARKCSGVDDCQLYLLISLPEQLLYFYEQGQPTKAIHVSTGGAGTPTPVGKWHPTGRIHERYMSKESPGGNYYDPYTGKALGNMPFAIFFDDVRGLAVHGTTTGNFKRLGTPASHGCVRIHPEFARGLNQQVNSIVNRYGLGSILIETTNRRVGARTGV